MFERSQSIDNDKITIMLVAYSAVKETNTLRLHVLFISIACLASSAVSVCLVFHHYSLNPAYRRTPVVPRDN